MDYLISFSQQLCEVGIGIEKISKPLVSSQVQNQFRVRNKNQSILWPPDPKSWFSGKDPDAGKDWGQEKKQTTEDEMVGWHHRFNGHEFEQIPIICSTKVLNFSVVHENFVYPPFFFLLSLVILMTCLQIHYLLQGHKGLQQCFLLRVFIVLALGLLPFPYEF